MDGWRICVGEGMVMVAEQSWIDTLKTTMQTMHNIFKYMYIRLYIMYII